MCETRDDYFDMVKRIEDAFAEIDSDAVVDLTESDDNYIALRDEVSQLKQDYPMIEGVLDGSGAVSLTADEHTALKRYVSLKEDMEDAERQAIYFRGHTDCFAYLKKIGAI